MSVLAGVTERLLLLLAGAMLGWLLQQYRILRAEDTSLINDHIKDVDKFSEAAIAYWLKKPDSKADERALAVRVHAAWAHVGEAYSAVLTATGQDESGYGNLVFNLYYAATSGTFEQADRDSLPDRALEVAAAASELINYLRLRRQYILSFDHLRSKCSCHLQLWFRTGMKMFRLACRAVERFFRNI